jgi:superfamily II DNA or RNA helicase
VNYREFLAAKQATVGRRGHDVAVTDVHPMLHGWQAEIVRWSVAAARSAIFADCGLGKTFMQLEWARLSTAGNALIVAPLSVARQTRREAAKIGLDVDYVRSDDQVRAGTGGLWVTNVEMVERFDPDLFDTVVLDESSILKNVDGKTRRRLTAMFADTPRRLACTATPAPNDVAELTNHAEWLGIMARNEMLAAYFINDQDVGWRLKGHAREPMLDWMATWAVALRRPSDLGWPDDGYDLPPLTIHEQVVAADVEAPGQLFPTDLGGVGGRAKVRRQTIDARTAAAAALAAGDDQTIVWCALNDEADAVTRQVDGAVNVEGSWTPEAKAEAIEAFQDGQIRVLVTKPSIAGFGMNFQQCARMVFCGLGDSYEQYYQAVRRCWRYGQTRPVDAHVVVSDLERQIVDNVNRKARQSGWLTDGLAARTPIRPVEVAT